MPGNMRKRILGTAYVFLLTGCLCGGAKETALDRYIRQPDPNFKYELVKTIPGEGQTTYVLDMTSQQFLTTAEVDRPVWRHWLVIVKPQRVTSDIGLLVIGGGENDGRVPNEAMPLATEIASLTGAVVAELQMVPNQPLTFRDETRPRGEDGIIAYTWNKFLRTGDERWPLRLPMTKAAVRAMDAISRFLDSEPAGHVKVKRFVVSGASKRGWTTWSTAAVDSRVIAIVPVVIDLLNIVPSFRHHYRAYGAYSEAVDDYEKDGILKWSGTVEYRNLMKIEEAFEYRERFTMPKLLINATGDEFFLPDSSQFYFDRLPGEKYLRYVPNANHDVTENTDAAETVAAYFESVVKGAARPRFTWRIRKDGTIAVRTVTPPRAVKLWQAHNPQARDFRLQKIGPAYRSSELAPTAPGRYVARVPKPATGFTAYFIELTFPTGSKYPLKFTTGVKVIPDVYPFAPPKPEYPAGSHPLH